MLGLISILADGKPPEHGLFNVNGKPVEPQLIPVSTRSKQVEVSFNGESFDVVFHTLGTYALHAKVGNLSDTMKIEVRELPLCARHASERTPQTIWLSAEERKGERPRPGGEYELGETWIYKKWPGIGIIVGGDPEVVISYSWIDEVKEKKEPKQENEKPGSLDDLLPKGSPR